MSRVVVIISLYKAEPFLQDLFGSLEKHYKNLPWVKIVAIDDYSPDATVERVRQEYPWVDLIKSSENLGFAQANNMATGHALKTYDPEFLFYLNQDTEVEGGFLEKLVAVMEHDQNVGIAQPLILIHPFSSGIVNTAGNELSFLGYGYTSFEGEKWDAIKKGYTHIKRITYAGGAALFIRASLVQRSGLFDPYFIAYQEDTDLSLRVWKLGYRVVVVPESRVAHKYTTPKLNRVKTQRGRNVYYLIERARFILFAKHYSTRLLWLLLPAFLVNEIGVMAFSLARGFWKDRLRVYWWLAKDGPNLLRARSKETQNSEWERKFVGLLTAEVRHASVENPALSIANAFWRIYFVFIRKIILSHQDEKSRATSESAQRL